MAWHSIAWHGMAWHGMAACGRIARCGGGGMAQNMYAAWQHGSYIAAAARHGMPIGDVECWIDG